MERSNYFCRAALRWQSTATARLFVFSALLLTVTVFIWFRVTTHEVGHGYNRGEIFSTSNGGTIQPPAFKSDYLWEKQVRQSCNPTREDGLIVLVTGAAGFVGSHVSLALKKRGDGLVGVDNFNDYYEVSLKRARQDMLVKHGIFVVDQDINNAALWTTLFDLVQFTHVMHLAAQAGVRYAMQNPASYVNSNIAGLVTLFEACKNANPQPSIVWASSSSVYGLNSKVCTCPKSQRSRLPTITYLWRGRFSDALCALSQCTSYCTFASPNA